MEKKKKKASLLDMRELTYKTEMVRKCLEIGR